MVRHLIERKAKELKLKDTPDLAAGSIDALMAYDWPGNVRELENVIERAMILHRGSPLRFDDLGISAVDSVRTTADTDIKINEILELDQLIKRHIQRVLELTNGKIHGPGGAGEVLGMNPDTLRYRMRKLDIPFRNRTKKIEKKILKSVQR